MGGPLTIKVGVTIFLGPDTIAPDVLAREVEARGFESLFVPEHTHIPVSRSTPYRPGGDLPEYYKRILDPFVVLSVAAAVTEHIRLGTAICLLAQRDLLVAAKEVATLDHVSGGRVIFGIGAGWNEDEIANHGIDPSIRWQVMREKMLAIKELWGEDVAQYSGEHVNVAPSWAWPKPIQQFPLVLLGARAATTTFQHIVDYCDGWMPHGDQSSFVKEGQLERDLVRLRATAEAAGRDPKSLHISVHGGEVTPANLEKYEALGAARLVSYLPSAGADVVLPALDRIAAALPQG